MFEDLCAFDDAALLELVRDKLDATAVELHLADRLTSALEELTQSLEHAAVVALGGGAVAQSTNRALLGSWPSVFLQAPADELWRRCCEDPGIRPLRKNREQFAQLYAERLPFYQEAALSVEALGKDPAAICAEIEAALHLSRLTPQS